MTLGLAVADDDAIYLAIESIGLAGLKSDPGVPPLRSKLVLLQRNPEIALLVAGGLDHWQHVLPFYTCQDSLDSAADELARLLNQCMKPENSAFGRLVGYDRGKARCLKVDRPQWTPPASVSKANLREVEAIGDPELARVARRKALEAMRSGEYPLCAILRAIWARFPNDDLLRMPVCTAILSAPPEQEALG